MGDVRAMTRSDVAGAMDVVRASGQAEERAQGREPAPMPDEAWRQFRRRTERFLERDPQGAFVAVEGDAVVGVAQSIRRSSFWGLSMLFVYPGAQSHGLGRRLLEAALPYSRDADVRMIMASTDPRAVRLYSSAGLAVHPAMSAEGEVDRSAIPTGLAGRAAGAGDLELVASVDESLRGSRAEDVAFLLGQGATLEVVDGGGGGVTSSTRPGACACSARPTAGQQSSCCGASSPGADRRWSCTGSRPARTGRSGSLSRLGCGFGPQGRCSSRGCPTRRSSGSRAAGTSSPSGPATAHPRAAAG